jgi:Na+-transporting methylmalonyl-CoA/oxaloacetate decarboxylase gamma subunit
MLDSIPADVMVIVFLVILMAIVDGIFRLIGEIHKPNSQEPD